VAPYTGAATIHRACRRIAAGVTPRAAIAGSAAWLVSSSSIPPRLTANPSGLAEFREPGFSFREQRKLPAANAVVLLADLGELVKGTVRRSPGLKVSDRITAAARVLRLPRSRVADWWYGEVRRVEYYEGETIRRYAVAARQSEIARMERQLDALRAELAFLDPLEGIRPAAAPRRPRRNRPRNRGPEPA